MIDDNHLDGTYRTTREGMMAAYDQLPPQARVTLANAIDNWVPQPVLACYHRTRDIIATVQMVRFSNRTSVPLIAAKAAALIGATRRRSHRLRGASGAEAA